MAKRKSKKSEVFTLQQAKDYLYSRNHAEASKALWMNCIITLTHYYKTIDSSHVTTLTKAELYEKYENINIYPLITDADKVIDLVMNKIENSTNGKDIALETKKTYIASVQRITDPGGLKLTKEAHEIYQKKFDEIAKESADIRNLNAPKAGNAKHPDFTWITAVTEYNQFLTEASFTNTKVGKKNLRAAIGVGFYVFMRPRRVQDFASLMYYSKRPSDRELEGINIIYGDGDKMFMSIDKFKTRFRTTGRTNKKKEVLPRFEKELNPRLAELLKDYIKKDNIPDMSKLTTTQKRAGVAYYILSKDEEHKEGYDDNSYSKLLSGFMKHIFKRNGLSVNTMRHAYNTFIMDNANMFNDKRMREISIEVGDKPRDMPTNTRYRTVAPELADIEKSVLEGIIVDNDYAKKLMEGNAEQAGSIQGDAKDDGEEEVVSGEVRQVPQTDRVAGVAGVVDEDLNVLYTRLGEATMQVELIKSMISKKLNF